MNKLKAWEREGGKEGPEGEELEQQHNSIVAPK